MKLTGNEEKIAEMAGIMLTNKKIFYTSRADTGATIMTAIFLKNVDSIEMKMNQNTTYFYLGLISVLAIAYFAFRESDVGETFLYISIIATIVFSILFYQSFKYVISIRSIGGTEMISKIEKRYIRDFEKFMLHIQKQMERE